MNRNTALFVPFLVVAMSSSSAIAQTAAPVQQLQFAAPVPGICLMGRDGVIGGSKAGIAGSQRLRQLQQQVAAELAPERQAIVQESTALQAGQKTIAAAQLQQRTVALQQRARKFNELDQLRAAQLERTRVNVEQQIAVAIAPAMAPVVARQKCSVVFERRTSYGSNAGMDITAAVIQEVDKRVAPTQFNLVTPEQARAAR